MREETPDQRVHPGPLAGIRIVDLTRLYPGPLATMMLAELGAEVIKIEDPRNPDPMRGFPPFIGGESAGYLAVNRSKKNLAVSIEAPEGAEILLQLVDTCDAVMEQFRPGYLTQLGCGYQAARRRNPKIIFVSLTGYGQSGPYAAHPGHDINFQGFSGLLSTNGTAQTGPIASGAQISDIAGGAYMAIIAVLSALMARTMKGEGQHVDVSMVDGSLPLIALQMAHYWAMGQAPALDNGLLSGLLPCYGVYRCKDDRYLALGALEEKYWDRFCRMVGKPEWIAGQYDLGPSSSELRTALSALFAGDDRDSWVARARQNGVNLTPVLELDELEDDPHLQERAMFVEQIHPTAGPIRGIAPPIKFSATPCRIGCAPQRAGADTADLLAELGLTEKAVQDLVNRQIIGT